MCRVPELIKIDVEGFETEVLRGLKKTLASHHPAIIYEHALYRLSERGLKRDEVADFLTTLGYKISRLTDDEPIKPSDSNEDQDFIARMNPLNR